MQTTAMYKPPSKKDGKVTFSIVRLPVSWFTAYEQVIIPYLIDKGELPDSPAAPVILTERMIIKFGKIILQQIEEEKKKKAGIHKDQLNNGPIFNDNETTNITMYTNKKQKMKTIEPIDKEEETIELNMNE